MLLRISIVRLKSPKTYIHTCDNCKSFNETDSGGRLWQTTYSRVTAVSASSELFGASPHSNINALAVAISFSFVFALITLFKLRFKLNILFNCYCIKMLMLKVFAQQMLWPFVHMAE